MSEIKTSPEMQSPVEKITYGDSVIYFATIKPTSFIDTTPKVTDQIHALADMTKKMSTSGETVLGTGILSAATSNDWPISKSQTSLVMIGSAAKTHPREALPKNFQRMITVTQSADAMIGLAVMTAGWKNLFKGSFPKEAFLPVAYFADKAIGTYGKNINISVDMPNNPSFIVHMLATKRTEHAGTQHSPWMQPLKPVT